MKTRSKTLSFKITLLGILSGLAPAFCYAQLPPSEWQVSLVKFESKALVRQLESIKGVPFAVHFSMSQTFQGTTRAAVADLDISIPGTVEADAQTGQVAATVHVKRRGLGESDMPQSFTLRFAKDGVYTNAPKESMVVVGPFIEVCFPNFLDEKKYPEATLRSNMKKGAQVVVIDEMSMISSLGTLVFDELDGEWAKFEARPAWEGPLPPMPEWLRSEMKRPEVGPKWLGKYVISTKSLLLRSADLTMDADPSATGDNKRILHLKLAPLK